VLRANFRSSGLVQRFEIARQAAADHVALERDVIAGRICCGTDLAFRCLAAAQNPDLDDRPFCHLAEEFTTEIMRAVVERDHRNATQDNGAEPLLGLLHALECGDDRAKPTGSDYGKGIDEIALARSRHMRADQVHGRGRKRAAHQGRQQSGQRDRAVEPQLMLATNAALEAKLG